MLADRNEVLAVMFPPLTTTYAAGSWTNVGQYVARGATSLIAESSIDLTGYAMEDLTFATFETMYQDAGIYSTTDGAGTAPGASTKLEVMELITDVPLSRDELLVTAEAMGVTVPGQIDSTQDFSQVIYGNYRLYVPNNTLGLIGYMQMIQSSGFGSKEPTASARLYCYRIIRCLTAADGDLLNLPSCRVGLSGRMYREDDLPYMMRLKRSYELATQG
jgi:hypothetical protein